MSRQTTVNVGGMSCGHCEMAVVKAVKTIPGVIDATASHEKNNVVVTHENELNPEEVKQKVAEAGYQVV